jgi:hypothetical protein
MGFSRITSTVRAQILRDLEEMPAEQTEDHAIALVVG